MRLARMGSFHQSRLSFMRVFIRRLKRENWRFEQREFDIDENCVGHAVYSFHGPQNSYSLVAFAHDLPAERRSDRVIAEAWDATFALFDGIPTKDDIERLSKNVPLQEAGRVSEKELSLSRANRSVRLWKHVVSSLAAGHQPDAEQIDDVGYLMRTTAVYGSGKFGAADRAVIADRPEFAAPFQAEMLAVYLIRTFVKDLVNHAARQVAPETAVQLAPSLAKCIGIGNSTGLGMAPFLLNHPVLLNNWIMARERAISAVRNVEFASMAEIDLFKALLARSLLSISRWRSGHPVQQEKLRQLATDVQILNSYVETADFQLGHPWNTLFEFGEQNLSLEGQELVFSLLLEPYSTLVDHLSDDMSAPDNDGGIIDGSRTVGEIRLALEGAYDWALALDWAAPENNARAWYVSEEKLEPRLGERFEEPIADYEQPLSPARDAALLYATLKDWGADASIAEFLLRHPEHRHSVKRLKTVLEHPYAEIRDNTISAEILPIDMLRCKLSFFGAIHFDPRSDRWVRICMFSNAPYPDELSEQDADFWIYPDVDEVP